MSHLQVRNFCAASRKRLLEYFGLIMPGRNLDWIDDLTGDLSNGTIAVTGTIDGVNTLFTVESLAPLVFYNGLGQTANVDYIYTQTTTTGGTLEFFVPPRTGSNLFAFTASSVTDLSTIGVTRWVGPIDLVGTINGINDTFDWPDNANPTVEIIFLNSTILKLGTDYTRSGLDRVLTVPPTGGSTLWGFYAL